MQVQQNSKVETMTSLVGRNEMAANLASEYKVTKLKCRMLIQNEFLGLSSEHDLTSTPKLSAPSIPPGPWGHWLDSACSQSARDHPRLAGSNFLLSSLFATYHTGWTMLNLFLKNLPLKFSCFLFPWELWTFLWNSCHTCGGSPTLRGAYNIAPFSFLWMAQLYCLLLASQPVLRPFR